VISDIFKPDRMLAGDRRRLLLPNVQQQFAEGLDGKGWGGQRFVAGFHHSKIDYPLALNTQYEYNDSK
jgi:hypothetical protein